MAYYKKDMNKTLHFKSNNSSESNSEHFNEEKLIVIEQLPRGRSINTVPAAVEIDSTVRSSDSNSIVGRHTQVLRQTDSSHQSVLGAPAPGSSGGSPTRDKMKRFRESDGRRRQTSPEDSHRNQYLGWMGKCGDYKNKQLTLKRIIKLFINTNHRIEKKYLDEYYNDIFNNVLNDFNIDLDKSNQFAFIIFIKKDGTLDTKYLEKHIPDFKNKKHSEDHILDLLKEIDISDRQYKEALIYSTNSLCFARKTFMSCMSQAIDIADKIHEEHKMKMIIGFYKPWGINGSYESILPYKPLKDCTYTFESQTLGSNDIIISNKTTTNKKEADKELLEPMHKSVIPDVQHKTFLMQGNITNNNKTEYNKTKDNTNEDNKTKDNKIEDNLTEENKCEYNKTKSNRTEDDIPKPEYNLEKFSSKIYDQENKEKLDQIVSNLFEHQPLNKTFDDFKNHGTEMFDKCMDEIKVGLTKNDANLYEEIRSYLQNMFFPWWAKKVEDASSRFLNNEISYILQERVVCCTLKNLKKDYFVIGYVKKNPEN